MKIKIIVNVCGLACLMFSKLHAVPDSYNPYQSQYENNYGQNSQPQSYKFQTPSGRSDWLDRQLKGYESQNHLGQTYRHSDGSWTQDNGHGTLYNSDGSWTQY